MRTRPLPAMKLAVIGGGSTYTPELVAGLARERERLDLREPGLQDIDPERREVVGGLAGRMLDAAGYDGNLSVTDDLDRALDGASFVLIQLRVGGQQARLSDETIPLACGCIGQETTGAGGLGKALRTRPVLPAIASRPRARAAEAAEIERELLELYRDPALTTKPKLLERRGGAFYSEAATQLVASLASNAGDAQVVDIRNNGTIAGLAEDDAVEVPARITAKGPEPREQAPLAPELLRLVQHVAAYERLAAAAAASC